MAEQVQAVLDSMVAPLRDLLERNIFSEPEMKAIVARRRESEYLVRRRAVRKADFLRYLQAEMDLEKLRALRTKKVFRGNQEKQTEKEIGDVHICQHIHFLFTRALRKFRSDVSIHLQYAEFCKTTRSFAKLGRIYAEALQVHPRNVGLWIEAASHEFFQQASVASARILLQRGLRVNSTCQDLWLQYFGLEFHHIQKLKGRREILQLEDQNGDDLTHTIPAVVYNNAIKAIPDNVTFRLKFLDMCRMFPQTQGMEAHIVETIARDFAQSPEAWIARAAFCANKNADEPRQVGFVIAEVDEEEPKSKRQRTENDDSPVLSVLEEATKAVPTPEMYVASIQFLRTYVEQTQQADTDADESEACNDFIHQLLRKAKEKLVTVSTELVLEEADVLVHEGKLNDAIQVLRQFCTSQENVEASVWLQWAKLSAGAMDSSHSPRSVLHVALDRTPLHSKEQMVILLELFGALLMEAETDSERDLKSELAQLFQRMLLLSAGDGADPFEAAFGVNSVAVACLHYLRYSFSTGGIESARRVYEQVLYRSNYTATASAHLEVMKEFIDECIQLEKAAKSKKKKQTLSRLFGTGIELFCSANPAISDSYRSRRDNDVRYVF
jgi:U3 small nucleolar RNA-associated protein 6